MGVVRGLSWLVAGRVGQLITSFLANAVLARLLSPADFGVMAAVMIVISLSDALFDGAFAIGLVQRKSLDNAFVATSFWLATGLSVVLIALIWASAPFYTLWIGFDVTIVLGVTAFAILLKGGGVVSRALLRREGKFGALARATVISYAIGYVLVGIPAAWFGAGIWSLAIAALVTAVVETTLNLAAARPAIAHRPTRGAAREVLRSSGFFSFAQVLNWSAYSVANAVIGRSLGPVALGIYTRSWKQIELVTNVTSGPLQSVMLPKFSRMQERPEQAATMLRESMGFAIMLFSVAAVLGVLHAELVVMVALGDAWKPAIPIVQIMFVGLLPRAVYKIPEALAYGFGKSRAAVVRQFIFAALMITAATVGSSISAEWTAILITIALWVFYIISSTFALSIVKAQVRWLAVPHFQALLIAACVLAADLAAQAVASRLANIWIAHISGGAAGVGAALLFATFMPASFVGGGAIRLREAGFKRLGLRRVAT